MANKQTERKRILVVDDNPDTCKLACTALSVAGFTAIEANNADQAVELVRDRVPDLLVIDYMMPEADGITTLRRCRALPGAANIPAVMLTADDRLATLEHALARGFDEFLPKTLMDDDEFVGRLESVIARRHY